MADEPKLAYRYKGPDTFPGVPARDLTVEEFARLPILRQLDVQANASYTEVKAPKPAGDSGQKEKQ